MQCLTNFKLDDRRALFEANKAASRELADRDAVCKLKAKISNIENKIDDTIFKLYELNDDEILLLKQG